MSELRGILSEQLDRLLTDQGGVAVLRAVEAGEWPAALWEACAAQDLPLALVPEDAGGVGLSWGDAAALWQVLGRHGAPVPLGEAMLGGWLLAEAGIEVPAGVLALSLGGTVPFGRHAARLAVAEGGRVALHEGAVGATGGDIGREPRDEMRLGRPVARGLLPNEAGPRAGLLGMALLRAALMAGALERVMALAVDWANTRKQFGRPIGKFQAVQQLLAGMASEVAATQVAVAHAARAVDARGLDAAAFEIASAKVMAGEAAGQGAAVAHQVFAAIGITEDHELHHFTRRLWSWRDEGGSEARWAAEIGKAALARGGEHLWADLTARDVTGQQA
jgi:acyl-CoA dehydrogenase